LGWFEIHDLMLPKLTLKRNEGRHLWLSARALVLNSGSEDLWLSATGAVLNGG
jgi:hypothetical protein